MAWFKRQDKGIHTPTEKKKEAPDGLWYKTPSGNIIHMRELRNNAYVCPDDDYHVRIGSKEYFEILFDGNKFVELDADMSSADPLTFTDSKKYPERIKATQNKTESMGSVVGEKIARGIDYSLKEKIPFLMISKSGGARMMEAGFSLMQMAKTSAKLALLSRAKIPYISLLTDPTTGGVTASYAMLGDLNIAEPGALIGFAGPRVIRETIGKDLPKGFQSSEFVQEHGFLDFIVDRRQLKAKLTTLLGIIYTKDKQ
jgi:acetyl-CoA carboxylase carboxyl transferase subunit beta